MRVAVWVVEEIGGTASEKTGSKSETNDDGGADTSLFAEMEGRGATEVAARGSHMSSSMISFF